MRRDAETVDGSSRPLRRIFASGSTAHPAFTQRRQRSSHLDEPSVVRFAHGSNSNKPESVKHKE